MIQTQAFPDSESVLALLKGRRSIRFYRQDPVPDEMLREVLEAGRWAPSATNRQPWHFVVVRDEQIRRQVAEHAAFYFVRWAHVGEAPLLIALCGTARNPAYQRYLHEDIGLAGGQMMLQAAALGLGTCWIGGLDRKAIASILQVPPGIEVVGLLTMGFPAEDPPPPPRKPLGEIVHFDVFGNREPGAQVRAGRLAYGPLGILLRRFRFAWPRRRHE
jgi:nitroreductase